MSSVIFKAYPNIRDKGEISLFKSYNTEYADGEQLRDFIYVRDVVDITLFFWIQRVRMVFLMLALARRDPVMV